MANRETLEDLLKKPLPSLSQRDPFIHTQQFPKFMKRRIILKKDYDIKKLEYERKNELSANSQKYPSKLVPKSIEDIKSVKPTTYDEAIDKQRIFTSSSPSHNYTKTDYRYSASQSSNSRSKSSKKKRKNEKSSDLNRKIPKFKDLSFSSIPKSNIKLLLIQNSPKLCLDCNQIRCTCTEDDYLISKVVSNLHKGKVLLDEIKAKKKMSRFQKTSDQKKYPRKFKISFDEDLMRYSPLNHVLPSLDMSYYRRNST